VYCIQGAHYRIPGTLSANCLVSWTHGQWAWPVLCMANGHCRHGQSRHGRFRRTVHKAIIKFQKALCMLWKRAEQTWDENNTASFSSYIHNLPHFLAQRLVWGVLASALVPHLHLIKYNFIYENRITITSTISLQFTKSGEKILNQYSRSVADAHQFGGTVYTVKGSRGEVSFDSQKDKYASQLSCDASPEVYL
jgi:hypothetical protein